MKEYIFVSSHYCDSSTNVKIIADNEKEALLKAYKYCGGSVTSEAFEALVMALNLRDIQRMFLQFVGDHILYFGEVGKSYIDDLYIGKPE